MYLLRTFDLLSRSTGFGSRHWRIDNWVTFHLPRLEPTSSDSDGRVGNVSEHKVLTFKMVSDPKNSKEALGHDLKRHGTLPQDLVIHWIWSGDDGICREEADGISKGGSGNKTKEIQNRKEKESKKEASIDLCYRSDWRPTGSAFDLVRDRILHWTFSWIPGLRLLAEYGVIALWIFQNGMDSPKSKSNEGYPVNPFMKMCFENVDVLPEIGTFGPREG